MCRLKGYCGPKDSQRGGAKGSTMRTLLPSAVVASFIMLPKRAWPRSRALGLFGSARWLRPCRVVGIPTCMRMRVLIVNLDAHITTSHPLSIRGLPKKSWHLRPSATSVGAHLKACSKCSSETSGFVRFKVWWANLQKTLTEVASRHQSN